MRSIRSALEQECNGIGMGESGDRYRTRKHKPILPFVLEHGLALSGFIKDLRYVAAFQNPQQAMNSLRETVLRNSQIKQKQQALATLAFGGLLILALVGMSKAS
jgi:hypothetical protein